MTKNLVYQAAEAALPEKVSGQFAKQVLVVLPAAENLEAHKTLLSKILSAVQLDFEQDVFSVEVLAGEAFSLSQAVAAKLPRRVLVFGFEPEQVGFSLQINFYQSFDWAGVEYLFSENLDLLENDRERKGKLWAALKAMFF